MLFRKDGKIGAKDSKNGSRKAISVALSFPPCSKIIFCAHAVFVVLKICSKKSEACSRFGFLITLWAFCLFSFPDGGISAAFAEPCQ